MFLSRIINRKGNYIVEASIVLPVFIIAVVMIISIIPIISQAENTLFIMVEEQKAEDIKANFRSNAAALPAISTLRVSEANERLEDFTSYSLKYKYESKGIDNLIEQRYKGSFKNFSPLGIFNDVSIKGKIVSRAFVGSERNITPLSKGDFSKEEESNLVYVFPESGEAYHGKTCRVLKAKAKSEILSQDIRGKFKPCKLCKSKKASVGAHVFCFENDGYAYHLSGCSALTRYYVEMEKEIAIERGYRQCSICGGN